MKNDIFILLAYLFINYMSKESQPINLSEDLDNELMNIIEGERKSIRREKFDLSSTRIVLDRLLREGFIKPDDKLSDVRTVIEEEFRRIEDV